MIYGQWEGSHRYVVAARMMKRLSVVVCRVYRVMEAVGIGSRGGRESRSEDVCDYRTNPVGDFQHCL